MAHTHPIGDDHPFPAVHALAQAGALPELEIVNVYDGALIRLFVTKKHLVFKLRGDPGSAMDRQRFDYHTHVRIDPGTPQEILDQIKAQVAAYVEKSTSLSRPTPRSRPK